MITLVPLFVCSFLCFGYRIIKSSLELSVLMVREMRFRVDVGK